MSRWLDRSGYVLVVAFLGGAGVAALIVLLFIFTQGGGEDGDRQLLATATAGMTPARPTAAPTSTAIIDGDATPTVGPAATATPVSPDDPVEALAAFVEDELGAAHIGDCPQEMSEGEPPPAGVCSLLLFRGEALATFFVGAPFSEFLGEAVLTLNPDGSWSVSFLPAPPLGESIAVDAEAMVYGVGSCLNFREEPSLSAEILSCGFDGTSGQVLEGPVEADEHSWWRLEGLGWASGEFLAPVAE